MIRLNKPVLCFLGIACFIVTIVSMYVTIKKRTIASLVERAQYAVYVNATTSCTNHVPRDVALNLADKIRETSSMRLIYHIKSVGFGSIYLIDGDMKPLVRIGVFRYPIFEFNRKQFDLQYDLVGALGFSIPDYKIL